MLGEPNQEEFGCSLSFQSLQSAGWTWFWEEDQVFEDNGGEHSGDEFDTFAGNKESNGSSLKHTLLNRVE